MCNDSLCVCVWGGGGGGGGGGGATTKVDTFSFKQNVNCQVGTSVVDAALLGGCLAFDENWMVGAHPVGHTQYTPKEEEQA